MLQYITTDFQYLPEFWRYKYILMSVSTNKQPKKKKNQPIKQIIQLFLLKNRVITKKQNKTNKKQQQKTPLCSISFIYVGYQEIYTQIKHLKR